MKCHYSIYQLKSDARRYLFRSYDYASKNNVSKEDYNRVYEADIEVRDGLKDQDILEGLFVIFNLKRPQDFQSWSMSVSDIVEINSQYYYCDNRGWKKIKF